MFSTVFYLTFVAAVTLIFGSRRANKLPYPPGPVPIPILGNVRDFTLKELWVTAAQWTRTYGDITYLHVLNWNIIFLGTREVADQLLDKRGALYSDRPELQMTGELCGVEKLIPFSKYNETFKSQRRHIQQTIGSRVIPSYHPLIQNQTLHTLKCLINSPEEYTQHFRNFAGGLSLAVVYGYLPKDGNDKFLLMGSECLSILANEVTSGGGIWAVDVFPFLKLLPSWFPGCGFKKKAEKWKVKMKEFVEAPFALAKMRTLNGTILPSFCSKLLNSDEINERTEDIIKHTANSMFAASADTFILAMLQYPDVMEKAQEEIDRIVGTGRLPDFPDRESLPYVEAVLSEVWRWGAPGPLNLPHCSTEDNIYNGMFIPKGTIAIANIWSMLRDESLFPNPDVFDPERYLNVNPELKSKRDPRNVLFGFGRRRCPGADLADSSNWMLLVSMLATLNIYKASDDKGEPTDPKATYNNCFFRVPDQLAIDIKPRSRQALELVEAELSNFEPV
ncbi:hypothetical protein V5O48_018225 [Marasmius crinis-equi]|uniref:Cytochrome P450 n=1 Tax=Marasmius crinis-equi TaxID=585013 RepID=A0ABR3ELS5_9AGAR